MRLKFFLVSLLATIFFLFTGCTNKEDVLSDPVLEVRSTLELLSSAGDTPVQIRATRKWNATISYEGTVTDWLTLSPEKGSASNDPQTVTFTAKENTGRDRVAKVKFTIGLDDATVTVTQKGPGGSADPVYFNDFDKAAAVKDGSYWPYLSQSDCWKNEIGTGIGTISYVAGESNKATVRNNSSSNGSGVNNIFFGSNAVFCVKDITLPASSNFTLSFLGIRNVYGTTAGDGKSVFDHSAFKLYISADNQKWVSLDYKFAAGDPDNAWDTASSTFTLPSGTSKLSIYFPTPTETSVYRLDDLKLDLSETAGTVIDFSKGESITVGGGDEGGGTGSNIGEPKGTGTQSDPFNASAAIKKAIEIGSTASTEVYYIKGFISSIEEITDASSYGNATFFIKDSKDATTDALYCYRVKYIGGVKFPTTDAIKVGDEVVVKAQLFNYQGKTPETNNGELVSINNDTATIKALNVSPLAITVGGSATSASFNVSANVAWTATCDNADFTLSKTSGDADATVEVTFSKNSGETPRVANITVSTTEEVATKSYTVVLTQKVPISGAGFVKVSSVSEVTDGSYVIAGTSGGKVYAMSNKNESTYETSYLNPHEIAVSGDVIAVSDGETYSVTITKSGNQFVIKGEKFISYTGSDTYFAFGDTAAANAWTLSLGNHGFVFTATNDTTRGLVYRYGQYHRFAAYKTNNINGTEYTGVQLYKLQD